MYWYRTSRQQMQIAEGVQEYIRKTTHNKAGNDAPPDDSEREKGEALLESHKGSACSQYR